MRFHRRIKRLENFIPRQVGPEDMTDDELATVIMGRPARADELTTEQLDAFAVPLSFEELESLRASVGGGDEKTQRVD